MIAGDDEIRSEGGRAIVRMPAEIDVTNAHQVSQRLRSAARGGPSVLIVDMSATTFCDSAGVQALIDAYNRAEVHNQNAATRTQLRLVATAVLRIITLVGIDQLIPVYPTVEAALADPPSGHAEGMGE